MCRLFCSGRECRYRWGSSGRSRKLYLVRHILTPTAAALIPRSPPRLVEASTTRLFAPWPGGFRETTCRRDSSDRHKITCAFPRVLSCGFENMVQEETRKQDPAGWLDPVFFWQQKIDMAQFGESDSHLGLPVFVIAQEVVFVPIIHRRFQK